MDTQELINKALEIRDEDGVGENTALRVGSLLLDIIDALTDAIDSDTLQLILTEFASLTAGKINWGQSRCVIVASMGSELDNVDGDDWAYTEHNGDIVFNPTVKGLHVVGTSGNYPPAPNVLYVNAHSCHAYKWDNIAQKMVQITDSSSPSVITYRNTPPFSDVAIGESYYYESGATKKIAVKLSSESTYSFDIDPNKIYVFKDVKQTMVWSSGTWVPVGGDDVELPMTDTENADLDFQDEDGNVIMRLANGHIRTKYFNSAESGGGGGSAAQEISILLIGNSLLQDAVSYLPLVLKEIAPNLTFKFYMWYDAGTTLAQLLSKWNSNGSAEIFSTCENVTSWTNANNSQKMGTFLASGKTFDIVVLEEYFNLKTESGYTAADKQAFNDVVAYLRSHYNKPFKVVSFFHRPRTNAYDEPADLSIADEVFELTKAGVQWQLQNTVSESLIPAGIAAYRAMYDSTLNGIGTLGYMSPDGTHAQEGLPSLMQAWVVALWVFDHLGLPLSINNAQGRVTSANWASINVPGPNPWSNPQNNIVVGTTAQDRAAMDIAIKAYKEGKYIELNALTSYTE